MARPNELRIRLAVIFDKEPEQTITDEIKGEHGAPRLSNFSKVPQNDK